MPQRRPPKDSVSSAALTRFDKVLSSQYEPQLAALTEEEYKKLEDIEEVKEVFDLLDGLGTVEEEEEEENRRKNARRRRSESILSVSTQGGDEDDYCVPQGSDVRTKSKGRSKKTNTK